MRFQSCRFIFSFIAILFSVSCASGPPSWYENYNEEGFIIGRGRGDTEDEAKNRALADISGKNTVRIKAITEIQQEDDGENATSQVKYTLESISEMEIVGAEALQVEKRGDVYYALYRYDIRPLRQKVKAALDEGGAMPGKRPSPSDGFKASLPFSDFMKSLGNRDFLLSYRNGRWSLSIDNEVFSIAPDELAGEFFFEGGSPALELVQGTQNGIAVVNQKANQLENGQFFSLRISPPESGYLSLFYVDNNGISLALHENLPVRRGEALVLPNPQKYPDGYIAEAADGLAYSKDMILALFNPVEVNWTARFEEISEQNVDAENSAFYGYGNLIDLLGNSTWSSLVIGVSDDGK